MNIQSRLQDGEHIYIKNHELFMSYNGTFWVRREMTEAEIDKEGFEEPGWHQVPFKSLDEALKYIGFEQLSLF